MFDTNHALENIGEGGRVPRDMDVIPYQSALRRLLRASVCREEQLYDYGLSQSLRSLFFAVQSPELPVYTGVEQTWLHDAQYPDEVGAFNARDKQEDWCASSGKEAAHTHSPQHSRRDASSAHHAQLYAPGNEAVLYLMCREATESADNLRCLIYLSVHLLCDEASHFGRGNDRPCVTAHWSRALVSFLDGTGASVNRHASRMRTRRATDRQFQLGYLVLLTGTVREVARGAVTRNEGAAVSHLFRHHLDVVTHCVTELLPRIACMTEQPDAIEHTSFSTASSSFPASTESTTTVAVTGSPTSALPTRLAMEANHCILHLTHWLCADALAVHMGEEGGDEAGRRRSSSGGVVDRDAPQQLWQLVTLVRSALVRLIGWITAEATRALTAAPSSHTDAVLCRSTASPKTDEADGPQQSPHSSACATGAAASCDGGLRLVRETVRRLQTVLSNALRDYERVSCAREAAVRRYGDGARDVHALSTMMWSRTMRMCVSLHELTRVCMRVHGGCALEYLSDSFGEVMRSDGDVIQDMARTLTQLPMHDDDEGGGASSSSSVRHEENTLIATDTLLHTALTLSLAAPVSAMQRAVWHADAALTQRMHEQLVQRALRYTDEAVLKLASLLMGSVWHSRTTAHEVSGAGGQCSRARASWAGG